MIRTDWELARVTSLSTGNLLRLRAAGITTVEHLLRASKDSINIAVRDPADRVAVARERERLERLTKPKGKH